MNKYTIKKQDGDYVVINGKGIIIAYTDTRCCAEEVLEAQQRDDERSIVEAAYNQAVELSALRAEFLAEFY